MILATDLEGTLTTGATWRGIGRYLELRGMSVPYRLFYLSRLPAALAYRAGLSDGEQFKNRWIADLMQFFDDMPASDFESVASWVVEDELWPKRREDILAEVSERAQNGARVIVASGSITPIVEAFVRKLGFGEAIATPVEERSGRLTGRLSGPSNTGKHKADGLKTLLNGEPLTVAYGDTLPDLPMLEMASEAVAVYPDKALLEAARRRGWRVLGAADG